MTLLCKASFRLALIFFSCFAFGSSAARADYLLSSGDLVNIVVYRLPELSREVTVDVDGRVAFPPLGLVDAKGLSVEALGERIRTALKDREILNDALVTVALVTARPVFISGDVAAPGAYPYRAGLTVRQAIALAGGLGLSRDRGREEIATLYGERQSLEVDLLREQARLARLQAELEGHDTLKLEAGATPNMPASYRSEILALEQRKLQDGRREAKEEKAYLERSAKLTRDRIVTLTHQQSLLQEQMTRQQAEIERIRDIQNRGLAVQTRVVEERRAYDSMQERAADNAAETLAVRGQLEQSEYQIKRFDDRRTAAFEAEKQAALLAIKSITARLSGVNERLAQLGSASPDEINIMRYRYEGSREIASHVTSGTQLQPGDTVEIQLRPTIVPAIGGAFTPGGSGGADALPVSSMRQDETVPQIP